MLRECWLTALSLGAASAGAVRTDAFAQISAWGAAESGQTSVPQTYGDIIRVAAGGRHSAALNRYGGLAMWGDNSDGQCNVPPTVRVTDVALGQSHTVALTTGGVRCWGDNSSGQCNVPWDSSLSGVVAVAAGHHHSLALMADGTARGWGTWPICDVPRSIQGNVIAIDGGGMHSLALLKGGTVAAWGSDHAGQASVPPDLGNVVAVAAGAAFSLALTAEGTVRAWGSNTHLQCDPPGHAGAMARIDAGDEHAVALRSDGTVFAWGRNDSWQAGGQGPADQGQVAAGGNHTVSARTVGTPSGPIIERWAAPASGGGLPSIQEAIDSVPLNVPLRLMLIPGTYRGADHAIAVAVDRTIEIIGPYGPSVTVIDGEHARRGIMHLGTSAHSLKVRGISFMRCVGTRIGTPVFVDPQGGAIRSTSGTGLTVESCRFTDCLRMAGPEAASYNGSAILWDGPRFPPSQQPAELGPHLASITACEFERCEAGAVILSGWRCRVTGCTFRECNHGWSGALGAVNCSVDACTFESNHGDAWGGGLLLAYSDIPTQVTNCTFVGNSSPRGGAICDLRSAWNLPDDRRSKVTNCTFAGNSVTPTAPGGLSGGGALFFCAASDIDGCTFVGNRGLFGRALRADVLPARFSNCTFDTCCPVWPADAVDWGPGNEFEERCIDCAGDIECDGLVDGIDLGIMLSRWGPSAKGDVADINLDGAVDGVDLGLLLATWGACPQ
jgi:hypothetical protein